MAPRVCICVLVYHQPPRQDLIGHPEAVRMAVCVKAFAACAYFSLLTCATTAA